MKTTGSGRKETEEDDVDKNVLDEDQEEQNGNEDRGLKHYGTTTNFNGFSIAFLSHQISIP